MAKEINLMSDKELVERLRVLSTYTGPAWDSVKEEYYDIRAEIKARRM